MMFNFKIISIYLFESLTQENHPTHGRRRSIRSKPCCSGAATTVHFLDHGAMYRVEKNGLQNITKQDPGRAEQVSKSSNKVHQTTYKPLFSTLYSRQK